MWKLGTALQWRCLFLQLFFFYSYHPFPHVPFMDQWDMFKCVCCAVLEKHWLGFFLILQSLNSSIGTCHRGNGVLVSKILRNSLSFTSYIWGARSRNPPFFFLQNGFPSRDGSIVLRYIPDPTENLFDDAFLPAPGECPSSWRLELAQLSI